ncbi:phage head completion protein, partial [Escherichia coli M114]
PLALRIGAYVVRHNLIMPDNFGRTAATVLTEEICNPVLTQAGTDADADLSAFIEPLDTLREIVTDQDMPDEVRAKLCKACAFARRGLTDADSMASSLKLLREAMHLNPNAGVKREIATLSRALKKADSAAEPEDASTPQAQDDITDTDDGDTRISAGAFWPDIVLRELRLAVRLPGRVTTSRLLHTATGAVAHVTRELEAWQQEQQAAGHQTLADVPAPVINGESVNLWHWRNAVYTATRALILERYRDADTTDKGDRRADALDIQTSDLWRDVSWAISDILRRPRIFAELC